MALYLIENTSHKIVDLNLKEILTNDQITLSEVIRYDLSMVNVDNVIEELDTYSMFNNRKVVYAYNADSLFSEKDIEHNLDRLIKYINNPKEDNTLILVFDKVDSNNELGKLIKKKFTKFNNTIDSKTYAKNAFEGYKIDEKTFEYLINNCDDSLDHIDNEINKLLMYKYDEKKITIDDINKLTSRKLDDNIFDFLNAVVKKDKAKSLELYNDLLNSNKDIMFLITMVSSQLRLMYQVKNLSYLSNEEISDKLKLDKPKRVMAIRYKIGSFSNDDLIKYLYQLVIIEEKIKLGKVIDNVAFPMFIANL